MIYAIYLLCLLILLKLERDYKSTNNIIRFLIPILYVFLIGLRGANVGVDTPAYYEHYYTFGQWGCSFVEVGFDWLNRILYHQGFSHVPFFVICALVTIGPVAIAVNNKLTRQEYSLFMLLFCTITFASMCNGMRQNMACGILFYLIFWYTSSNWKLLYKICIYILGVYAASLFHASVLIVAPIIFLSYLKLSNKIYLFLYLLSFIFIFINISSYIPDVEIGTRDYGRFMGGESMNRKASLLGFSVAETRNFLFLLLLINTNAFKKHNLFATLSFIMLILAHMNYNIPIIGRINMYFVFFYIYMLPKLTYDSSLKENKNLRSILTFLFIIISVLLLYSIISPTNKLRPYMFYWEAPNYTLFHHF